MEQGKHESNNENTSEQLLLKAISESDDWGGNDELCCITIGEISSGDNKDGMTNCDDSSEFCFLMLR